MFPTYRNLHDKFKYKIWNINCIFMYFLHIYESTCSLSSEVIQSCFRWCHGCWNSKKQDIGSFKCFRSKASAICIITQS